MNPNFIDAYLNWAVCLAKQRKFKPASILFQKVLEMSPDDLQALCELGTLFIDQFLFEEAIGCFERVLAIEPEYSMVYAPYGHALFYLGDFEKAVEFFDKVMEVEPDNLIARNMMGLYFLINMHYEMAIMCFQDAVNQNSEFTMAWINWSLVLKQEGKKKEAAEIFYKGISLMDKVVNPNGEEQLIELYTETIAALERIAWTKNDLEKLGLKKTIMSIKWILEYLRSLKEEEQQY